MLCRDTALEINTPLDTWCCGNVAFELGDVLSLNMSIFGLLAKGIVAN